MNKNVVHTLVVTTICMSCLHLSMSTHSIYVSPCGWLSTKVRRQPTQKSVPHPSVCSHLTIGMLTWHLTYCI